MAKIKHLAIVTLNPQRLAKFYESVFDMKVLHSDPGGACYLTDGYFTLALLPNRANGKPTGLNHFGFEIEDADEITQRLADAGMAAPAERPADRPYAETRATDPDGNNFDLSVHGYQNVRTEPGKKAGEKKQNKVEA